MAAATDDRAIETFLEMMTAERGARLAKVGDQQHRGVVVVAQQIGGQRNAAETLIFDDAQTSPLAHRRAKTPWATN